MKITQQTSSVMVLKSSGIGGMILGLIVFIFGGVFLYLNLFSQSGPRMAIWIPIVILAVGVLIFLFSKSSVITFDKDQKIMTVSKSGAAGKSSQTYPLDGIAALEIMEEYRTETINEGNARVTRPVLYERLSVAMKDGSRVLLSEARAGSGLMVSGVPLGMGGGGGIAQQVATFIGVSVNRVAPGLGGGLPPMIS